jgi:hypothetical protein
MLHPVDQTNFLICLTGMNRGNHTLFYHRTHIQMTERRNLMNPMTSSNLKSAFGGESMAHMRYLIWGEAAKKEKFPNVANLFKAVAYAEQVHAANHFRELKKEVGEASVTAGRKKQYPIFPVRSGSGENPCRLVYRCKRDGRFRQGL